MEYRTFTGDDKGQIKSVNCELPTGATGEHRLTPAVVQTLASKQPIQRIRCYRESDSDSGVLAVAQSDGQITTHSYTRGSNELKDLSSWKETRLAAPDRFVGLEAIPSKGWLSCTQHGRLRLSHTLNEPSTSESPADITASLPMRLNDMRFSPSSSSLAYGGNEVDLSVWDVERTFSEKPLTPGTAGNKRKKGKSELMYAEIWRAKQLPNDSLSLRQPVHITSLAFLRDNSTTSSAQQPAFHIVTGNASGAVRRFDTRAARRPVANWENVAKTGGIRRIECGRNEYEIFVSDNGSNLSSLDTRTGKIAYSYKSLSGAACSFTPISTTHLASISLDRIFRLHSVFPPPPKASDQQVKKGAVLGQEFMKSTPTVIVWDGFETDGKGSAGADDGEDEDVWEGMEVLGDDGEGSDSEVSEEGQKKVQKRRVRK